MASLQMMRVNASTLSVSRSRAPQPSVVAQPRIIRQQRQQRRVLVKAQEQEVSRSESPGGQSVPWTGSEASGPTIEAGKVLDLMAVDFEAVLAKAGSKLVMVDVYTQWCGPCKMIAPEIEVMAGELGDSVILSKIDCTSDNDNKKWAMAQKVRALPTFIFFKNGERVTEMTGAKTSSLRKLIDAHK